MGQGEVLMSLGNLSVTVVVQELEMTCEDFASNIFPLGQSVEFRLLFLLGVLGFCRDFARGLEGIFFITTAVHHLILHVLALDDIVRIFLML